MVKRLKEEDHSADAIHGNLRQNKRDRVINSFRKGTKRILIATDVASRGLDIPLIQHVINYDLPQVPEDYIHRIGRTARAGSEGSALTFLTRDDKLMWNSISKLINPNFKAEFKNSNKRFNKNKRDKLPFNKKRKFKDKKKFFNKERNHSDQFRDLNGGKFNFKKGKKRFFKKKDFRVEGYTNNPKYLGKQKENAEANNNERKKFNFKKGKKRFKNRSRPISFKFKKHNRSRN
jgi:superfamily II DNA/RNA helicase